MQYTLRRVTPQGDVRSWTTTFARVRDAAVAASHCLCDNGAASKADAQKFGAKLSTLPVGTDLTHAPSGYVFRIDQAQPAVPDLVTETLSDVANRKITKRKAAEHLRGQERLMRDSADQLRMMGRPSEEAAAKKRYRDLADAYDKAAEELERHGVMTVSDTR